MQNLSKAIRGMFEKLLFPEHTGVTRVIIEHKVIEDIISFARSNPRNEFVAILEGSIKEGTITVDGLLYQPFLASRTSASMSMRMPLISRAMGSVHSHPTPRNAPSQQDLDFFRKHGILHMIIGYPYTEQSIAVYDLEGNKIAFEIR
jgi:proteasome lid subunit RPN8/RPN11